MRKTFLVLLLLWTELIVYSGCSTNRVTIHPVEGIDIVMVKEGQDFKAPKDGAFLSLEYIHEVMKAKIK